MSFFYKYQKRSIIRLLSVSIVTYTALKTTLANLNFMNLTNLSFTILLIVTVPYRSLLSSATKLHAKGLYHKPTCDHWNL